MGKSGIVYVVVGAIAIIGAVAAAYFLLVMASAVNVINSADASQLPPGTDLAALQQSVSYLNMFIILGSVWVITVVVSGLVCIRAGIRSLRTKTKTR